MAASDEISILLAQYNALRAEIANRSKAQADAVQLTVTATGALGALSFAQAHDTRLLFLIPVVATVLGLFWLDHAANIFNIGDFIKNCLMPRLKVVSQAAELPDYEEFVRHYEKNRLAFLRAFGLPPFFTFIFIPAVSIVIAFDTATRNWVFWMLAVVATALLLIFVAAFWIPFALGPRRPTQGG